MQNQRNILDQFRDLETEEIRTLLKKQNNGFATFMENWEGDFNIGTMLRNANAFGAERLFYMGKRSWDRRGAVGTHHYTDIIHIEVPIEHKLLKTHYTPVALENNVNRNSMDLRSYEWPEHPLMVFGSESEGLSDKVLDFCEDHVTIPQFGSVRSYNAGVSSGIVMYDYITKNITRESLV